MYTGCTSGFRQQWDLGQDLWLRTRFYFVHCTPGGASDTAVQEEEDTAQALPTAVGRLQHCMRIVPFRSIFSRRQKTPELLWMLHTVSVSSCVKLVAVGAGTEVKKSFLLPSRFSFDLKAQQNKQNEQAPPLCNMTTVALFLLTHKVL